MPDSQHLLSLADELEASLWNDLIRPWFPACIDSAGGFYQVFDRDWNRGPDPVRFIVFQSRMAWVGATLAEVDPAFRDTAAHGLRALADRWIEGDGAVNWMLDAQGVAGPHAGERHTYGASFAIYALAALARSLESDEALTLAQRAFEWLEEHAYDAEHFGYFECTDLGGKPLLHSDVNRLDGIGTPYGQKSQNTHLHLLEAFAELARVWRDKTLLRRLDEMAEVLEVRLRDESGALHVYAERDWTPVPGRWSYGHDIEAAHLLLDAGQVLHGTPRARTFEVSKGLVEHSLRYALDPQGGLYNTGEQDGSAIDRTKVWWVQAEALLGLARAHEMLGFELEPFENVWNWTKSRQIDRERGGWFEDVDEQGHVRGGKGHAWKAAYHDSRGLLFSARALRRAASAL